MNDKWCIEEHPEVERRAWVVSEVIAYVIVFAILFGVLAGLILLVRWGLG